MKCCRRVIRNTIPGQIWRERQEITEMTLPVALKCKQEEDPEGDSLNTEEKVDIYVCNICGKNFYKKSSWVIHVNSHNISNNSSEDGNVEREVQNTCNVCFKKFTAKKNLLKHLRDVHKNFSEAERMVVKKIKCPERNCEFLCRMMKELREHIEKTHKVKILKDILQFPDERVFQKWKKEEESNTASWFVTGRKKTTLMDGTKKQMLYCHRTGHYSPKGFGKYKMRSTGSCKIGVTCPAAMEVIESPDGGLNVIYYKTHLGHIQDVTYLKLSSEERADLAEKIKQGFSFDAILDDVKESQDIDQEKKKRIHLLSKKDLYSIMRTANCNNRKSNKKEQDERVSESIKTKEFKTCEENPLIVQNMEIGNTGQNNKRFNVYHSDMIPTVKQENDFEINKKFGSHQELEMDTNIPQSSKEDVASQIVILSPDLDYTSVAEIIFLPASNATPAQSTVIAQTKVPNLENSFIHKTESQTEIIGDMVLEESNKVNKSNLHLQLKEKLQKITELLPNSEYLTPKQFDLINAKLNRVLDIFGVASAKANTKKQSSRRKVIRKSKILKNSGKIDAETEFKVQETVQLYENPFQLYAVFN